VLRQALYKTALKRGSQSTIGGYREIVKNIVENPQMQNFWAAYQEEFDYAKDISFGETCETVLRIVDAIGEHGGI
jgi:hypothetical protein